MSTQVHEIISLAIAVGLGAMVGLEREVNGKPAGLRTNILICLGAAAFTIISKYLGTELGAGPGRMAAAIVTGVGFLGAGVLIHEGSGIHGLTTAASIWLVASIGVACGAGLYLVAAVVTAMALFVLLCLSPITKRLHKKNHKENT